MKKRRVLIAAILVAVALITENAWAASSGDGSPTSPYIVNSAAGTFSPSKSESEYYVTVANLYSNNSDLYYSSVDYVKKSYAVVKVSGGTGYSVDSIVVRSDEYVTLSAGLTQTSEVNGGTLTISANGNTVKGNSDTGSNLKITSGYSADVWGSFNELSGSVVLCGDTKIHGGTPSVTGNGKVLYMYGGTASVSGDFSDIYVYSGATVNVGGDTEVTNYHVIEGTVNVNSNNTLCIAGNSIKSGGGVSFDSAHPWQQLASGTYDSVVGNWTLSGDVTIKGTACAIESSYTGATIKTNKYALTVTGGKVMTSVAAGDLAVTGGVLEITDDTLADGVSVSGTGKIKIYAGKTLCDGSRSLSPTDGTAIQLSAWGTLGTGTYTAAVVGAWDVPSNASVTVTSTDCGCKVEGHTEHSGAELTGNGGTLTASADGVAVDGSYGSIEVSDNNTLGVSGNTVITDSLTLESGAQISISGGKTVCDMYKSVCPNTDTIISVWGGASAGTLPGSTSYSNLTGKWYAGDGVLIQGTGYTCGTHTHSSSVTITGGAGDITVTAGEVDLTGAVSGTVYAAGGTVTDTAGGNTIVSTGGTVVGTATSATDGTTLDAGNEVKLIKGSFASITGTALSLAGDTVIYSTGESDGYAAITGNVFKLDVKGGDVRVQGTFGSVTTSDELHVLLAGDAVINGGCFKLTGNVGFGLTVGGGFADIEGNFKQITVNGGTVTDCDSDVSASDYHNVNITNNETCLIVNGGEVVLNNGGTISATGSSTVAAVQVNGGQLTIGKGSGRVAGNIYKIYASSSGSSGGNTGIDVRGGECLLLDGLVNVSGTSSKGIQVYGSGAIFRLGTENNTYAYDSLNTPTITANSENSYAVYVNAGGEAWLHAGNLYAADKEGYGIYVTSGNGKAGVCHVWGNDQYGANAVGNKALLYIHGANNATAAMWVASGGAFDIRGRGILFEEPSDYNGSQYALYIHSDAVAASDYPLSGGTFDGKVRYVNHDISDLLLYNHYLRYDGTAPDYGFTDGTYGVRPGTMTDAADGYGTVTVMHAGYFNSALSVYSYDGAYNEYFGIHGEYYTVTDGEWELRQQMSTQDGCYQIPAGIVRSDTGLSNAVTLDINVFDTDSSAYTPCWGVDKKLGDVDVAGTGHTLYLAGRTLRYDGKNWGGGSLNTIITSGPGYGYGDSNDWRQVVDVNSSGGLELRDSVLGSGFGTNPNGDKTAGGYIGTGTVSYEWADDSDTTKETETRAVYATGKLDAVSAKIQAALSAYSSGISVSTKGTVTIGKTDEDNDNRLIRILGGLKTGTDVSHGVYMDGGTVTISGGIVGTASSQSYGGNVGVENAGGTLNIAGGIVAGNTGSGKAVWSTGASAETYITGGCLYGTYLDDDANGGANNGDSVCVTDGTVYLSIDAAHSGNAYQTTGYTENVIPFTGTGAFQTKNIHHLYNITVEDGTLYVGALSDYDENYIQDEARTILSYSRDNGYLLCTGGCTVFYDGIVIGDTTIVGDASIDSGSADFGTEFYVADGSFGDVSVEDGAKLTSMVYYGIYGSSKLTGCVQLHGGSYSSIDVSGLTTGWSGVFSVHGAVVNNIVGFWSNGYDVNDDGNGDWIRYNHYATMDKASRNTTGYWTGRSEKISDTSRFVGTSSVISAVSGKTIYVHDGADEFINWLTSSTGAYDGINGETYKMRCNVWLGTDSNSTGICETYFHCGWRDLSDLPVAVGAGAHTIDTNNFGIFGDHADSLISVGSAASSVLNLTNSNTSSSAGKYENLIRNYAEEANAAAVEVVNGTLAISAAANNANTITVKAYDDAVLVSGTGSVTLSAGEIIGKGSDTVSDGINMTGNGRIVINGGQVSGQANGISVSDGSISMTGKSGENVKIIGQSLVALDIGTGCSGVSLNYAELSGVSEGVACSGPCTLTVSDSVISGTGDSIKISGAANLILSNTSVKSTGNGNGITMDGAGASLAVKTGTNILGNKDGIRILQSAALTISGGSVTGQAGDGVDIDADSTASISGGTVTGSEDGVDIAGETTVTVSGTTAQIHGNIYGMSQNAGGSKVTITGMPILIGNSSGFYKANVTAETSLGGGLYSSIITNAADEKLSDIIASSTVKESAQLSTRAAQESSTTISDYVLENESTLKAAEYDDDGDNTTDKVAYSEYFILGVSAQTPTAGGDGGGGGGGGNSSINDAEAIVNGESQSAGTFDSYSDSNGRSVGVVTIDAEKLQTILDGLDAGATITVPITDDVDVASEVLTGEMVNNMAERSVTLIITTASATYTIPASEIDISTVSEKIGKKVDPADISVSIQIAEPTEAELEIVENAAAENGFDIVSSPVSFSITFQCNGKTEEASNFNAYVTRKIALPDDVDSASITTAVVIKSDGTVYHVPTYLTESDGSYYVVVNSLTNSTYAVIYHPVEFTDAEGHWAKNAINDMGSRMIVSGASSSTFEPDRSITRAEFAAIIVRALGLAQGSGSTDFADVSSSAWYSGYVETAYAYGIITGYNAGTFGPNDLITREQSMTMIARAMKITGLSADTSVSALTSFEDLSDISSYALGSVAACVSAGLVNGRDGDTIAPQESITRAEIAVIVQRLLQESHLI